MNDHLTAILSPLIKQLDINVLVRQIKEAFGLTDEPAAMLLRGLQASQVKDIGAWISKHSINPRGDRKAAIKAAIAKLHQDGVIAPDTIPWKDFYNKVRDACPGGWITHRGKQRPGFGFENKTIERAVKIVG